MISGQFFVGSLVGVGWRMTSFGLRLGTRLGTLEAPLPMSERLAASQFLSGSVGAARQLQRCLPRQHSAPALLIAHKSALQVTASMMAAQ
jgi:hypothetical protein